jgi:hypothetical protein
MEITSSKNPNPLGMNSTHNGHEPKDIPRDENKKKKVFVCETIKAPFYGYTHTHTHKLDGKNKIFRKVKSYNFF